MSHPRQADSAPPTTTGLLADTVRDALRNVLIAAIVSLVVPAILIGIAFYYQAHQDVFWRHGVPISYAGTRVERLVIENRSFKSVSVLEVSFVVSAPQKGHALALCGDTSEIRRNPADVYVECDVTPEWHREYLHDGRWRVNAKLASGIDAGCTIMFTIVGRSAKYGIVHDECVSVRRGGGFPLPRQIAARRGVLALVVMVSVAIYVLIALVVVTIVLRRQRNAVEEAVESDIDRQDAVERQARSARQVFHDFLRLRVASRNRNARQNSGRKGRRDKAGRRSD
jgi:hypothetical protein